MVPVTEHRHNDQPGSTQGTTPLPAGPEVEGASSQSKPHGGGAADPRRGDRPTGATMGWTVPLALFLTGLFLAPILAHAGIGFWGAGVCHRINQRTFIIAGRAMPLCARCTGLYVGFLVTVVVTFARGRRRPSLLPPPAILIILFSFLIAVGVDGLNSYLAFFPFLPHLYEPHNTLRLATGTLEGIALASFFIPVLHMTLWQEPQEARILDRLGDLGLVLLTAVPVDLLILWHPPCSFFPLSILNLAGLFLALGTVNTLLVSVTTRRAGRVTHWQELITLFLWGCLLALIEVAAMAWFRFTLVGSFDFTLP